MLRRLVLAQSEADPGLHCTVVSMKGLGPIGASLREAGIEVVALEMSSVWGVLPAVWRLWRLLRRLRPDLVQTWMVHADLLGGIAARLAGVRAVVWGVRTTDFSINPLPTRIVRWLCARLSSLVPARIVCAAQASRLAHEQAGYDKRRMRVIPNGFELDTFRADPAGRRQLRAELGLGDDELVVGCLGRYNIAKDQPNFVAAAGQVARQYAHCRFLMVGRGIDAGNADLMRVIGSTGEQQRFVLLGERSDARACLGAMDIFVLPSRSEGFPNVVGEAMAMQLPCVVTDVGDAAFLVGGAGIVVSPQDPAALADAIGRLIEGGDAARHRLGTLGRARLEAEFSMHNAAKRFTMLHAEVVAESAGAARAGAAQV